MTRADIDRITEATLALSVRCNATPTDIADGSQVAHEYLADGGIRESRYAIMNAVADSIPPEAFGVLTCDEAFAAYTTVRRG